jgi:hypothetical protein
MPKTTRIKVTALDNECYILASTPTGSSEVCHLKSGGNNPVDYTVVPQSILPPGDYDLVIIGVNWGGPQALSVTLVGPNATYTAPAWPNVAGVFWSQTVPITV